MSHSPEPWILDEELWGGRDANGRKIFSKQRHSDVEQETEVAKANRRRIVACINACAGIDTRSLEMCAAAESASPRERLRQLALLAEAAESMAATGGP